MKLALPVLAAICLLTPSLSAAGPSGAADAVPFPPNATSQSAMQAWMNRYLPTRGYVVGAWSPNAVMLVSVAGPLKADAYPQVSTRVLTQALTPAAARAAGWRAAVQTFAFACDANRYRPLVSLYYARADRTGGFSRVAGDGVWLAPEAGAMMDTVERAACFWGKRRHAGLLREAARAKAAAVKPTPRAKPTSKKHVPLRQGAPTPSVGASPGQKGK